MQTPPRQAKILLKRVVWERTGGDTACNDDGEQKTGGKPPE